MEIRKYQLEPIPREVKDVNSQDNIYLSIEIGNGQVGGNIVSSDNILLAKGDLSKPTFIGNAEKLVNEIDIETNVLDVNPRTNICVITTTFINQENEVLFTKIDQRDAPENGIANFKGKYVLRILSILICILSIFYFESNAQKSSGETVSFEKLETPSSPGFILLDQTPSSIEKPTTPQGLVLSFLGFQNNSVALEYAPFWLTTHPKLKAEKMYKNKVPVLYNFSVSMASLKTDSSDYLAGGFRTRLFQIYGKRLTGELDSIKMKIISELSVEGENLDTVKIREQREKYMGLIEKPLFSIDIAAAMSTCSNTNSFKDTELNRWAVWLAFNWRPQGEDFYITALTRYIDNEKHEGYSANSDLIDLGTRLNYDISIVCISLEYLNRMNLTEKKFGDERIALIGSVRISDNFYITTTLGKNFSDVNNIIALAGINFGFSKSKLAAF